MFRHLWWRFWWHAEGTHTPGWIKPLAFGVCWQTIDFNPKPKEIWVRLWRVKW